MIRWLRQQEWPWWQAGLLLGLLNALTFYVSNYYLSTSTTFSRAAGMVVSLFSPEHVAQNAYWAHVKPVVDWQFMLVIGLFIGAFLAAKLSGSFQVSLVPDLFAARFGQGTAKRWGIGLLGGVLLGFGARMADGCTSGHTLSGAAQLALSGWVATAGFFIGGIAVALLIYGRRSY
jgi:uncharacterized membrane protein YedE/YeeE